MSPKRGLSVLVTVLFTDIVGSTEIAVELGDRKWRDLVRRHHAIVRAELKRHRGRELDTAGDGFFARFDRPADAIRCACAISDEVRTLGIEIRAGIHLGEAEVLENKVGGIAVNVGARVMAVAKGGEVLVSSTLRDAVAGSGFAFADHGTHRLKGIDGEWRLFEVTAVDGVRRGMPLSADEARGRREFVEAVPVRRGRVRIVTGAIGVLVVALLGAGFATGALGGDDPPVGTRERDPTDAERALIALVPGALRGTCVRAGSSMPDATASLECSPDEMYSLTYASFRSDEDLRHAFEAFASPSDPTNLDCARHAAAWGEYSVNGSRVGEVACYVEGGTSPATSESVIVWTDEAQLVLARALRGDAADLTLYEWWRTETGPWETAASPPKDGEPPAIIEGVFRAAESGHTLTFQNGRYEESAFGGVYGDAAVLYGKPSTVLMLHEAAPTTFGGVVCPRYEVYRWRLRGDRLSLRLLTGGCREYASEDIAKSTWTRVG
jgi:class 3 adenylate cyclase